MKPTSGVTPAAMTAMSLRGSNTARRVGEIIDRNAGLQATRSRTKSAHSGHKIGGSGVVEHHGNAQRNRAGGVDVDRFLKNSHDIDRQLHG